MQSVSPVFTADEVQFEREIAKTQPCYIPVIGLPVTLQIKSPETGEEVNRLENWAISLRMRLSDEERKAIAAGDDLVVTQLVFGKPLAPMNFQLCPAGVRPVFEIAQEPPPTTAEGEDIPSPAEGGPTDSNERSNLLEMPAVRDGNALSQCICGHERHDGKCGKPRYSTDDPCQCETFHNAANTQADGSGD